MWRNECLTLDYRSLMYAVESGVPRNLILFLPSWIVSKCWPPSKGHQGRRRIVNINLSSALLRSQNVQKIKVLRLKGMHMPLRDCQVRQPGLLNLYSPLDFGVTGSSLKEGIMGNRCV